MNDFIDLILLVMGSMALLVAFSMSFMYCLDKWYKFYYCEACAKKLEKYNKDTQP